MYVPMLLSTLVSLSYEIKPSTGSACLTLNDRLVHTSQAFNLMTVILPETKCQEFLSKSGNVSAITGAIDRYLIDVLNQFREDDLSVMIANCAKNFGVTFESIPSMRSFRGAYQNVLSDENWSEESRVTEVFTKALQNSLHIGLGTHWEVATVIAESILKATGNKLQSILESQGRSLHLIVLPVAVNTLFRIDRMMDTYPQLIADYFVAAAKNDQLTPENLQFHFTLYAKQSPSAGDASLANTLNMLVSHWNEVDSV